MAMNMRRAFSSKFLTSLTWYVVGKGYYDINNDWIKGTSSETVVRGVMRPMTDLSNMGEGIQLYSEDGGARYGDFMTLYVTANYQIEVGDKLGYKGKYYNILEKGDKDNFGYLSYTMEHSKEWRPTI